jgi:hypothetical protein
MHTERDLEILDWIGCLGAAGADHVMERFEIGRSLAYRRLMPDGYRILTGASASLIRSETVEMDETRV